MSDWNSELYSKFLTQRTQPAIDLANRINLTSVKRAADIGCGPGNSTKTLSDRFPGAALVGLDSSANMIEKAKSLYPQFDFRLFDASKDFAAMTEKFDVVFSNACIQWIPEHRTLLKNMMSLLNEGGVLAVQTPVNYKEPIHRIISDLAERAEWKSKFPSPRIFYNLKPGEYFDVLSEIASDFEIWETVYFHAMPSHESIMEWYKSTGLRPYLSALNEADAARFESEVFAEVVKAYPKQRSGQIIFRFPRLFFTAVK